MKTNAEAHRVARIVKLDGPEGLEVRFEPRPAPGPGQVLLEMKALGLNRAEAMFARGSYLVQPELPSRIGVEGVGIVAALGEGVEGLAVGQRVAALSPLDMLEHGLAADYSLATPSMLVRDIAKFTDVELAAFWIAHLTAYAGLVQQGRLQKGQTALVTAASSSAGLAAIAVAKAHGARVVATTRSGGKADALRAAGADRVIASHHESIATCGESFDVAFDAVGGPGVADIGAAMARGGRIVVYGLLSGNPETPFPLFPAFGSNLSVTAFHVGFHCLAIPEQRADATEWLSAAARTDAIKPTIDSTFELDAIADAYRHLEGSEQIGKIVVTP